MPGLALWVLLVARACADVSLVRIVQSQTNAGESGLLGKAWITSTGSRMRIVSGFVSRAGKASPRKREEPLRLIQVLDLGSTALTLIDPPSKTYQIKALSEMRYADSPHDHPASGAGLFSLRGSTVTIEQGRLKRKLLGQECSHYHIEVRLGLRDAEGHEASARMLQDVWVAPVMGEIQKGLLDLITFEANYRRLAKTPFSPLDHETYQIREAAAYLRVPEKDLGRVIGQIKQALIKVPGYPLSSSVSWWRQPQAKPAAQARPRRDFLRPLRKFRPFVWRRVKRFRPVSWGPQWRDIDEVFVLTGGAPPPPKHLKFSDFKAEMGQAVEAIPAPPKAEPAPFYEIYSRIESLSFVSSLPAGHFSPPPDYTKR